MSLLAVNPYFVDWLRAGEPEEGDDIIYRLDESITDAMSQVDRNSEATANQSREMTTISGNMAELVDNLRRNIGDLEAVLVKRGSGSASASVHASPRAMPRLPGPRR